MRDANEIKKGQRGGEMFRDMFSLVAKYWTYDPIHDGTDDAIGEQIEVDAAAFIEKYKNDGRIGRLADGFALVILNTLLDEERDYRNEQKNKST